VNEPTPAADELHAAVDLLVTALSVDDDGARLADAEQTDAAIEDARAALRMYQEAGQSEHTPPVDVLAEALQHLFDWANQPVGEQDDFNVALYALEMARYQFGGDSAYLGASPFG
jgi:type II secretory pathway pseudopilin PulG